VLLFYLILQKFFYDVLLESIQILKIELCQVFLGQLSNLLYNIQNQILCGVSLNQAFVAVLLSNDDDVLLVDAIKNP